MKTDQNLLNFSVSATVYQTSLTMVIEKQRENTGNRF